MLLNIPVIEAVELIKDKTQKLISLKVVDKKTINVGYDYKFPVVGTKFINVDLIVDKIVDKDLYFHYTTGKKVIDVAVNALLSSVNDSEILNKLEDGGVIHLDKIEKMNTLLDKITLEDISFDCDSILVKFRPKM